MSQQSPQDVTQVPAPRTEPTALDGGQGESGRYLYAVCRGLEAATIAGVGGIGGEPLELVAHLDLVAVVSTVPMSAYGEEALHRNLEDLAWLEETVRKHDDVIQAAATQAPTAPLRLATICFDDAAVRARLREWYVSLTHVLDRVEGCSEWSVKVLTPPAEDPPTGGDSGQPVSGAEYLRRKKAGADQRADADEEAAGVAQLVHDRLAEMSNAARLMPAQDPRLSGHRGTMVLNAAYLVPDADADSFAAELASLAADHAGVVLDGRGPWPPYSFAMLEQR